MKVSIVTISFNQARFLERALVSVISQDYDDIEYIVVDPGSTDGSREIIWRHRSELAQVVLEPDNGPADGLNRGFGLATGDILAYVNADDALLPGAVREAVDFLSANPDVDVVYGDGYMVDGDGNVMRTIESSRFNLRRYAYGSVMVLQQATFIRRAAFDRTSGFNVLNRTCWDGELLVDIAVAGGTLVHVPKRWGAFAIYPETITGSQRLSGQAVGDLRRIFTKARGRAWHRSDNLFSRVARLEKWLLSPRATLRRLRSALSGSSGSRLIVANGQRIELVARTDGPE